MHSEPEAVEVGSALAALVDSLAASTETIDAAFYILEDMHAKVGPHRPHVWC